MKEITTEAKGQAEAMVEDILSKIEDPAKRIEYAKHWAKTFSMVPALQAEAEAFADYCNNNA